MRDLDLAIAVLEHYLNDDNTIWDTPRFSRLRALVGSIAAHETGNVALESDDDDEEMPPGDPLELARAYAVDAMAAIDNNNVTAALTLAQKALELNPDSSKATRVRSLALFQSNRTKEAYADMCTAQSLDYNEDYDLIHNQMREALNYNPPSSSLPSQSKPTHAAPPPIGNGMEALMQNPEVMAMASNMMKNPDVMRNMMGMFGAPPAH